MTISSVPWYKERLLQRVSLGSLLMIVLLRTAHYNLAKLKVCRRKEAVGSTFDSRHVALIMETTVLASAARR